MAKIIIIDNNRSTGVLLKKALEHKDNKIDLVANWLCLSANIKELTIDLVLIHQTRQEDFGWTVFNQFKNSHPNTPTMLCVMPDYSFSSIDWIVKSVQEALAQMNKIGYPPVLWTWDTGFNETGTDRY